MMGLLVRLACAVGVVGVVAVGDLVAEPHAVGWMDERATWSCVAMRCDDGGECVVDVRDGACAEATPTADR